MNSGHIWKKTADNADAPFGRAARRCFAFGETCFAAALELLKIIVKPNTTPKRLRSRSRLKGATATRCATEGSICVICGFFPSVSAVVRNTQLSNLGVTPICQNNSIYKHGVEEL